MCKYVSGASLKDVGVPCVFSCYVVQLLTVLKNSNKNVHIEIKWNFLIISSSFSETQRQSVKVYSLRRH